ncbi:phage tail tape measure protein [Vibrio sp. Of7-15]|uniref:phage tail tape measure protein n=1 Tax=Vibrio sp. Of7-15 TaxID=2724879 RepID=UPI001EF36DDD|nr:phage tail tape measure protein [Vibrio sp. Of7-15]
MSTCMDVWMQTSAINQVTTATSQISKSMDDLRLSFQNTAKESQKTWGQMASDASSLVAGLQSILTPAIQMDRVMGDMKSLGVVKDDLEQLTQKAHEFAGKYGKTSEEFLVASYHMKTSMGEAAKLTNEDLIGITDVSAVLAVAIKSDTQEAAQYMSTMYSTFKESADKIGVLDWSKQLAGMTAQATKLTGASAQSLTLGIQGLDNAGSAHGIDMSEQIAVLGMLGSTMPGVESGEKYEAFLNGALRAAGELDLTFTDQSGKLLPMYEILEAIKGKYGELNAADMSKITAAFTVAGSGPSSGANAMEVINALIGQTELLNKTQVKLQIPEVKATSDVSGALKEAGELGKLSGFEEMNDMASATVDQFQRLESSWFAMQAVVFGSVLPAITAVVGVMADGVMKVVGWTQEFPILAQILGGITLAIIGVIGALIAWNMIVAFSQLMMGGWAKAVSLYTTLMRAARLSCLGFVMIMHTLNLAMLPVALGLLAVIGVVAALIYFWDDLKAALADFTSLDTVGEKIDWLIDKLNMIPFINIKTDDNSIPEPNLPDEAIVNTHIKQQSVGESPYLTGKMTSEPMHSSGAAKLPLQTQGIVANSGMPNMPMDYGPSVGTGGYQVWENYPVSGSQQPLPLQGTHHTSVAANDPALSSALSVSKEAGSQGQHHYYDQRSQQTDLPVINGAVNYGALVPGTKVPTTELEPERAERINQPINDYLRPGARNQKPVAEQLKESTGCTTDNSRTQHVGDVHINQQQPFTPAQLAEWMEMNTP